MFTKYRELGLALIPIRAYPREKMKAPIPDGWSEFCERLPTEAECEAWERAGYNRYGLACGPSSGIMAVDIDSDDVNVLNAVKPSPVRKRGKKGETRFFRYDPEVPSTKVAGCIDILALGRQTLLPPTTHPDGMPYVWLTPDTLENFAIEDLPFFTADDLAELRKILEPGKYELADNSGSGVDVAGGPWYNDDPTRLCPHGSQDRLKRIANAMISRSASLDEAIRELLRYDEEKHKPVGYFADHTRADFIADPVTNAISFYASNLKTFNRRQIRSGQTPAVPIFSGSEILEITIPTAKAEAWKPLPYPEPSGLIKNIRDLILTSSKYYMPGVSMAGAVSACSVLIANKYRLKDTLSNIYTMVIAPTGTGKQFAINAVTKLLVEDNDTGLFGKEQVLSGQALLKGLDVQRERLDVIDECSSMFHMIIRGGTFQADVLPLLLKLYSRSGTLFVGPETKGTDPLRVFSPCLSLMMLTNAEDLRLTVTRNFMTGGFLPRLLTFVDYDRGVRQPKAHWDESLADKINSQIQILMKLTVLFNEEPNKRNLMCPKPIPRDVRASEAALKIIEDYDLEIDHETEHKDLPEYRRHLLSRAVQNATKLALIHGVTSHGVIEKEDAEWGVTMVKALIYNSEPIYEKVMAGSPAEAAVIGVIEIIRKHGSISEAKFYEYTRILTKAQRSDAVEAAIREGKIRIETDKSGKRYTALS